MSDTGRKRDNVIEGSRERERSEKERWRIILAVALIWMVMGRRFQQQHLLTTVGP